MALLCPVRQVLVRCLSVPAVSPLMALLCPVCQVLVRLHFPFVVIYWLGLGLYLAAGIAESARRPYKTYLLGNMWVRLQVSAPPPPVPKTPNSSEHWTHFRRCHSP
jgi:hypothetical protein